MDTAAQHAAMFIWSEGHATLRDLVAKRLTQIPTIVKISTGFRDVAQPHRFYFREGTLYLVRSVRFQQLVVARTPDSCYVTIPRDCPLTFRLLNHDDQPASAPMTLSEILGNDAHDERPCNGQRVQLYLGSTESNEYPEGTSQIPNDARGVLRLEDIYTENSLLCHAFVGGKLSGRLTVLPGYLPVKLAVSQSMTSPGSNLSDYVSHLCQAVAEYSSDYGANDPLEITVFSESPDNHYERIDTPPIIKTDVLQKPNLVSTFKLSSTQPVHSASNANPQVVSVISTHTLKGSNTSRDQAPPRRPLPPVPQDTEITSQPDLNYNGGLFTNYASSQIAGSSTRRYDQPSKTSTPLSRSGSESNLLDERLFHQHQQEGAGRQQRLSSSHSLEFLNVDDPTPSQREREKNKSRGGSGSGSKSAKSSIKDLFVSLPRRDVFLSMPRSRRNRQSPESSTGTANKETVRATNASSALYSQFGTGVTSQNATRYSSDGSRRLSGNEFQDIRPDPQQRQSDGRICSSKLKRSLLEIASPARVQRVY